MLEMPVFFRLRKLACALTAQPRKGNIPLSHGSELFCFSFILSIKFKGVPKLLPHPMFQWLSAQYYEWVGKTDRKGFKESLFTWEGI